MKKGLLFILFLGLLAAGSSCNKTSTAVAPNGDTTNNGNNNNGGNNNNDPNAFSYKVNGVRNIVLQRGGDDVVSLQLTRLTGYSEMVYLSINGLPAGVTAEHVRVAEQGRTGEAVHFLHRRGVGVGVVAERKELLFAKEAVAAGDGEGDDDSVALFDFVLIASGADFLDDAHGFMSHDVAGLHEGDEAVEEVEVGAADGGGGDTDDGVAAVEDFGIGDVFDLDFARGAPGESFHARLR